MTNTYEETGIVQADIAEFGTTTLKPDSTESTEMRDIKGSDQKDKSSMPKLEQAIIDQFKITYQIANKSNGSDFFVNPNLVPSTIFSQLPEIVQIGPSFSEDSKKNKMSYQQIPIISFYAIEILKKKFGEFFFKTDTFALTKLSENSPNIPIDFSALEKVLFKIGTIEEIHTLRNLSNQTEGYVILPNPFLNLLYLSEPNERKLLYPIICEAERKKAWGNKPSKSNTCTKNTLRDLLHVITYDHIISYAERINDPLTEKYSNLLIKIKTEKEE